MQKWLCVRDIPLIKSRVEYLSDENHFEFLMSFIFNPRKQDTIKEWVNNIIFLDSTILSLTS